MGRLAASKGFNVIAGHSLHTPENYIPMIAGGNGNEQATDEKEKEDFDDFISRLDRLAGQIKEGGKVKPVIKNSFTSYILPAYSRTKARHDMGDKYIDYALCDECGICKKKCPYGTVKLNPRPIFDEDKCYGCWACYNHCPKLVIYTKRFKGIGHYPGPHKNLVEKLKS